MINNFQWWRWWCGSGDCRGGGCSGEMEVLVEMVG